MSSPMPAAPPDSDLNTAPRKVAGSVEGGDTEDIRAGEVVADGRYRIESVLGQGGMATVFRAKDLQRGREVALKVIAQRYVGRPDREMRFENEGRFAGRLKGHRNIAAPLHVGRLAEHGGRMFLAMELARGPTLLDLVSMHGRLEIDEAVAHIRDVARALRDLHASGVVHRDIKPSNVIVVESDEGRVAKLVDFGLAADVSTAAEGERLTKVDERPGTHHYMSPEQAWGAGAHPIFDVYGLGVTFYELLVGEPPFFELSPAEVLRRKCDLSLPAPTIVGRRHDLPAGLAALVDECLAPRATDRVQSAAAFLNRLDEIRGKWGMQARGHEGHTGLVGVARTIEEKKKEPNLRRIVAEAAAAKAEGRPGPVELTPIRTGATRPEIAADREALASALGSARGRTAVADAAVPMSARGATVPADAAHVRGRGLTEPARTPGDAGADDTADTSPAVGRMAMYGLLAGIVVGVGAISAWWVTSQEPAPVREPDDGDRWVAGAGLDGPAVGEGGKVEASAAEGARAEDGAAEAEAEASPGTDAGVGANADTGGAAVADGDEERVAVDVRDADATTAADVPENGDDGRTTAGTPDADGGKATPVPAADPWTPARCESERNAAEKALSAGRYAGALGHTRIKKCWPQESARQRIRALAFFELLRYDDCISAGAGSSDPTVARTVRRCQKARDAQP